MSTDEYGTWIFEHRQEFIVAKRSISGGIAGVVAKTVVAPFSRVTILMQCQSMRPHKFHTPCEPNNTRLVESFQKIVAEEGGVRALWKGNGAAVVHRFPYVGVTFGCLELFNTTLRGKSTPTVEMMCSSIGAATVAVSAAYPLDVVKTRLTTQTKTTYYTGIIDCLKKLTRDEGYGGLYRGLGTTLCAAVPNVALNLFVYAHLKEHHAQTRNVAPSPVETLAMGATAGFVSSMLLFPADLLRRQMQMEGLHGRPLVYDNSFDAVRKIFLTGYYCPTIPDGRWTIRRSLRGAGEFYRGLIPELAKVVPYAAVQFLILETLLLRTTWPGEARLMRRSSYVARLR